MTLAVASRIARRELRGGLRGFAVFLLCLMLGVTAIAAVGMVRSAIQEGLRSEGAVILGGDAEMTFTYRPAFPEERRWMEVRALRLSEVYDFRSMAVVERGDVTERGLTQVKAVDDAYPLVGAVTLSPDMPLATALDGDAVLPGAVMQQVLIDRLGLAPGDRFKLGVQDFVLMAALEVEPDASSAGFALGPRTIVRRTALEASGLLGDGTLYETRYRLDLPEGADLAGLETAAETAFRDSGVRWRDARNGAPGVRAFVDRISAFLVLVGLAGLAVGGVGISASVRAYLASKTGVIATLKTLGADRTTIFAIYLLQVGLVTALGVASGVVLGAALPLAMAPLIEARLPVPVAFGLSPRPLAEAALYGTLTALVFALWPLARSEDVRAAALFRDPSGPDARLPRLRYLLVIAGLLLALVGLATALSDVPRLALWTAGAILAALLVLALTAWALRRGARWLAKRQALRHHRTLRTALGAIGGAGEDATAVVLSLGLGLTVLAAVGQIDSNLRGAIQRDLPEIAPSYFFVDIQPDQMEGFLARLQTDPAVSRVDSAPMLRGVVTRINGLPAREVAGDHWVLRGDRGVTYSQEVPRNTSVVAGDWWPADYDGPPLASVAAEEAGELGLSLGDRLTVNILGRDIEAEIASFREVDFSNAGIGFVLSLNPAALRGAPHTHIATVYAEAEAEAAILRDLASAYPNITAIRVRDAIDNVARVLRSLAAATSYGAGATLLTGFVVLIGAAAAGVRGRIYEAAILKTLGATRPQILLGFALRALLLGTAAGAVALVAGATAAWAVMVFVMDSSFQLDPGNALAIVLGGIGVTLLAGISFSWPPLAARPARVLRAMG
ncbi:ABC transporter permease [Meridianimarinicoccus sp. MJW13]|uniref:ABC transporter permease n=1 Tax=Meridianimarinicoccus sp. MJW13 TaxID=2720031 RepID=UPI0018686007|nr:FtsX-like permease family protein [Fluviibacterium sp. MJW13]